jgi:integrase
MIKADRVVRKEMKDGTVKEYRYSRQAAAPLSTPGRYEPGTVGDLLVSYRRSSDWLSLSASSKASRNSYLRHLEEYHAVPSEDIKRALLLKVADAIRVKSGPSAANGFINITKKVYNWAIERGEFEKANPAYRIKKFPERKLPAFTRDDWDKGEAQLPEPLRRVLVLGRYTGQRRGDLVGLTWGHYDGQMLRFTQQKKKPGEEGQKMALHVHPDLKAELDAWKAQAQESKIISLAGIAAHTILTNFEGGAWHPGVLSYRMRTHLERIGLREGNRGLNIHGLRKMACAILAEEGASVKEIQGVSGHKTLAMIQLYTESADRERLGKQAILKLPSRS